MCLFSAGGKGISMYMNAERRRRTLSTDNNWCYRINVSIDCLYTTQYM